MKKTIVYDFDKTLTYKDTLLGFFIFCTNKNILFPLKIFLYFVYMILTKLKLISNTRLKELGVKLFLKGISSQNFTNMCDQYKAKIKFNNIYKDLEFQQDIDYYIITASFEDYVKPIFPDFVKVLGSKIDFKDDKVNKLVFNCYGASKVKVLKTKGINKIDLFFTDSYSDFDLAKISKKIYIVEGDLLKPCIDINSFMNHFKK